MERKEFAEKLQILYMVYATDQKTREMNSSVVSVSTLNKRQTDADKLFHELYADFCEMERQEKVAD